MVGVAEGAAGSLAEETLPSVCRLHGEGRGFSTHVAPASRR